MVGDFGTGQKLAAFVLAVAVAFGGGALLGSAVGPDPAEEPPLPVEHVEGAGHG